MRFGILVAALHTLIYHDLSYSINLDILIDILHIAMPAKSCKKNPHRRNLNGCVFFPSLIASMGGTVYLPTNFNHFQGPTKPTPNPNL